MVKHGRKEQFSVTISTEVADDFYKYMEKHQILYKNLAFEQLLKNGLNYNDHLQKHSENDLLMFKYAYGLAMDTALQFSKSKQLKKTMKVHYETIEELFNHAKSTLEI